MEEMEEPKASLPHTGQPLPKQGHPLQGTECPQGTQSQASQLNAQHKPKCWVCKMWVCKWGWKYHFTLLPRKPHFSVLHVTPIWTTTTTTTQITLPAPYRLAACICDNFIFCNHAGVLFSIGHPAPSGSIVKDAKEGTGDRDLDRSETEVKKG